MSWTLRVKPHQARLASEVAAVGELAKEGKVVARLLVREDGDLPPQRELLWASLCCSDGVDVRRRGRICESCHHRVDTPGPLGWFSSAKLAGFTEDLEAFFCAEGMEPLEAVVAVSSLRRWLGDLVSTNERVTVRFWPLANP